MSNKCLDNIKILHLAQDEKFIDMGLASFERVGVINKLIVFTDGQLGKVKFSNKDVVLLRDFNSKIIEEVMNDFDIIILHSLFSSRFTFPEKVKVIWIGFGFDYYPYICDDDDLLLEGSLLYSKRCRFNLSSVKNITKRAIRKISDKLDIKIGMEKVISRIDYFSPVLVDEYIKIRRNNFPRNILDWNYGTLEDDLIKGFELSEVNGDNILLGNSATITNNHIDSINMLSELNLENKKIVIPLSYGNGQYRNYVDRLAMKKFGNDYVPLIDYMSMSDYVRVLQSCSVIIMNHLRQQALGNIIIGLHMGAKIYLQEKNPIYGYLKGIGFVIYSISEVKNDNINSRMSKEDVNNNRELLSKIWSRDVIDGKTKSMIETVLEDINN
ncbi:TDP-N-acetylfucosamine:lipid II N-acetylfucosaminyltransferase [Vibrio cyclitrophicus]|uniref:TDP-N-acetylfucosamine:lipid II N-acetylfucosaminyltransferase n=1 Tax=Vibrio cyclitrophicus TaxID=47951 RepID=UPI000C83A81F|nr:TDP-N-acetylfucosamine:lipid II N-acetylfucosaminyltransferase [Vibrio cyclitrophicus]PMO09157.1 hypothetical protein BCT18_21325 [Vibrio cyclitrophicus]